MPGQDDYTVAEWKTVALGPMMAGAFISTADHAGPAAFLKEAMAVVAAVIAARETAETELVASIAAYWAGVREKPGMPSLSDAPDARRRLLQAVRDADAIVQAKNPDAMADYRLWCLECGLVAARAHHEGASPDRVTDAERAAFAELATALHITRG